MVNREALREYTGGSLWVLPSVAGLLALATGYTVSQIDVGPESALAPFAFQGTADDARDLLVAVSSTVVTVMALVLGLTVVALQLSSTQFSPRLLRNFLRDRHTQVVLSVFLATFAYSAAGLYTVGVESGSRVEDFPRLAVSGSITLLFASLGAVVYFADHLTHSIQIDAITRRVERGTLGVIRKDTGRRDLPTPGPPPAWAVRLASSDSGYVQTVHAEHLLPVASAQGVQVLVRPRVGEFVVRGSVLAWAWRPNSDDAPPDARALTTAVNIAVHVGFERTLQQDAAFGVRQLVDITCKALSAAINDPYTAVQGIDHLSVVFCELARHPLGCVVLRDPIGRGEVTVPGRLFGDYLSTMCGLVRRYGAKEPTVMSALLRLLENCAHMVGDDRVRLAAIDKEAGMLMAAAERHVEEPSDLAFVRAAYVAVQASVRAHPSAMA